MLGSPDPEPGAQGSIPHPQGPLIHCSVQRGLPLPAQGFPIECGRPAGLCFIVAAESKWGVAQTTAVIRVTGVLSCRGVNGATPEYSRRGWGRQLGWEGEADHSRQSLGDGRAQAGMEKREMLMPEERAKVLGQPETPEGRMLGKTGKGWHKEGSTDG